MSISERECDIIPAIFTNGLCGLSCGAKGLSLNIHSKLLQVNTTMSIKCLGMGVNCLLCGCVGLLIATYVASDLLTDS